MCVLCVVMVLMVRIEFVMIVYLNIIVVLLSVINWVEGLSCMNWVVLFDFRNRCCLGS